MEIVIMILNILASRETRFPTIRLYKHSVIYFEQKKYSTSTLFMMHRYYHAISVRIWLTELFYTESTLSRSRSITTSRLHSSVYIVTVDIWKCQMSQCGYGGHSVQLWWTLSAEQSNALEDTAFATPFLGRSLVISSEDYSVS